MWFRYHTLQWVLFVGPCEVRYFVGVIVSSQVGWGDFWEYREEICGGGFYVVGYDLHSII